MIHLSISSNPCPSACMWWNGAWGLRLDLAPTQRANHHHSECSQKQLQTEHLSEVDVPLLSSASTWLLFQLSLLNQGPLNSCVILRLAIFPFPPLCRLSSNEPR